MGTIFQFTFPLNFQFQKSESLGQLKLNKENEKEEEKKIKPYAQNIQIVDPSIQNQKFENQQFPLIIIKDHKNTRFDVNLSCPCSKILIVDDEFALRTLISNYAKRLNIPSEEAENGVDALEKVKLKLQNDCCRFYNVIIIDFYMPLMNGIEASLEIRNVLSLYGEPNITKIILVSGMNLEEEKMINNLNPSPFYIVESKPLSFMKFKEFIQKLVN